MKPYTTVTVEFKYVGVFDGIVVLVLFPARIGNVVFRPTENTPSDVELRPVALELAAITNSRFKS